MTSCLNATTEKERRYNPAHVRTRNAIMRVFGIWKRIFATLECKMKTNLRTANNIITAWAVFHNMAIESRYLIEEPENVLPDAIEFVLHVQAIIETIYLVIFHPVNKNFLSKHLACYQNNMISIMLKKKVCD